MTLLDDHVWLFVYGGELVRNIHDVPYAIRSETAVVPNAFLSWDLPGIPYVSPAKTSLLIRDVNDYGAKEWNGISAGGASHRAMPSRRFKTEEDRWEDYVLAHCCPGDKQLGIPPPVEGVVLLVQRSYLELLVAKRVHPKSDHRLIQLHDCRIFNNCDSSTALDPTAPGHDKVERINAWAFIAKDDRRRPWLMPEPMTGMPAMWFGLLAGLSQPYIGRLSLTGYYPISIPGWPSPSTSHPIADRLPTPTPSFIRRLVERIPHGPDAGVMLIKTLLLPFVLLNLLLVTLATRLATEHKVLSALDSIVGGRQELARRSVRLSIELQDIGVRLAVRVERTSLARRLFGSGWWKEDHVTLEERGQLIELEELPPQSPFATHLQL